VRRTLFGLFASAAGKDVVSRVWRKVRTDREVLVPHSGFVQSPHFKRFCATTP
jgi:hypothetical protein